MNVQAAELGVGVTLKTLALITGVLVVTYVAVINPSILQKPTTSTSTLTSTFTTTNCTSTATSTSTTYVQGAIVTLTSTSTTTIFGNCTIITTLTCTATLSTSTFSPTFTSTTTSSSSPCPIPTCLITAPLTACPVITVSPTSAKVGATVTVSASGFKPSDPIVIYVTVASCVSNCLIGFADIAGTTNANGILAPYTFTIAPNFPLGQMRVILTDSVTFTTNTAFFTVTS